MSRSAAALAYEPDLTTFVPPPPRPTCQFRLLGGGHRADPAQAYGPRLEAAERQELEYLFFSPEPELFVQAYFTEAEAPARRWHIRVARPRWLVGTFFGVVALAALASPVLARDRSAPSPFRLSPSGYTGSAVAGQPAEDAPEIDTTTGESPAPVQPQSESAEPPSARPYSVIGPPSLSVAQIETVLRQYGSPAVGQGSKLYDLGVRYGIDPAYALAFFVHESGCGTKGVARFTSSLGNIRCTEGFECYEGYRKYPSWEAGMEDWYKLITELYIAGWNLRTVDEIIPVYAPWGDNNHPPTYIASVKAMVDSWRGK